ncbi:ABC transporter ATP-binding protein [Arthrobacter sp. Br18]|uniref:ABC transporter ATP-binding protein n=1 Tax=Arthrobacter sp. Br18 TaxID=1312954 RepID=UPI0004BB86D9|nr:ABC transporter ATP-binding protein [Arthrobacter sp. Br18]
MSSHLEFQSISRSYGDAEVLHQISLTVQPSGCVALLGASGCGKTTLLRIAAGLDEPSSGEVLVDGENLTGVPSEERGVALVFQKPLLFPHLSVVDNVAFSAKMAGQSRKASREHAMTYLKLVKLADLAHRSPGKLSGGQEQRVALARALARTPRILLLDEPFSSLDSRLRDDMYSLMDDIRAELAPTIILVTHDRREASILADSIAVLDSGWILQHGPVSQLHYQPATLAVNRILGGLNAVPGRLVEGVHHSALGRFPVQPGLRDGPAFLTVRQEAIRIVAPADGSAMGSVTGLKSLGAHTLVHVTGHGPNQPNRPTAVLTIEVPGDPGIRIGQDVGLQLVNATGWAVTR